MESYTIRRAKSFTAFWPDFAAAESGCVGNIRPESSAHHPGVAFRILHDREFLYLRFDVEDRYVRSVSAEPQASVCGDSCVEAFLQPFTDRGYFNFEMNAGGNLHVSYIEDPERRPVGFKKYGLVTPGWICQIVVESSLPRIIDPEIQVPCAWSVACRIPFALLATYTKRDVLGNKGWRGNFYKCADRTSHPHWLAWSPVPKLNFHDPSAFGTITLQ